MSKTLIGAATLMGSVIGAGILGIPYVFASSGLLIGSAHIIIIGLLLLAINLFLGEVCLRTQGTHEITGYAYRYLGKKGSVIVGIALIIQVYGALIAYTIGQGEVIANLIGGSPFWYSIMFFFVFSYLAHKGLNSVGKSEMILISGLVLAIFLASILSFKHFQVENISLLSSNYLLPYGVVLFALSGFTSVPLIKEMLFKEKKKLKNAIIIGSVAPIAIYLLFAIAITGIIGVDGFSQLSPNERMASIALQLTVGGPIAFITTIFALLAMATSFLVLFTVLKETYSYDLNISDNASFWLTFSIPLLIFVINSIYRLADFISILGFVGTIGGSIMGISIVIMYYKARKEGSIQPAYKLSVHKSLGTLLVFIFILGILSLLI